MTKILILYGTTEGQTGKIAQHLADTIGNEGYLVDLFDAEHLPQQLTLTHYAAMLIGASMHIGGYQRCIHNVLIEHHAELAQVPSAFFAVSLTEAYAPGEHLQERAELQEHITRFLQETGWQPQKVVGFAGALTYSRYGFLKRRIMQNIASKVGQPTDASQDYEYTDWEAVTHFGKEFVATLAQPNAPALPL
jgi:menaquinone-dependent protoporphyrinogen oxidase